jgi:hypothetical protein
MPQADKGNYKAVKTGLIFAIQNLKYVECDLAATARSSSYLASVIKTEGITLQVCNLACEPT